MPSIYTLVEARLGHDKTGLTPEELRELLHQERTLQVATLGRDGWPWVVPLGFMELDGHLWVGTSAKTRKVRNLERDRRAGLLVEAGTDRDDPPGQLRGITIEANATIHDDFEFIIERNRQIFSRYPGAIPADMDDEVFREQMREVDRTLIEFEPLRVRSWDYRKL
jgi:general stress protein 26